MFMFSSMGMYGHFCIFIYANGLNRTGGISPTSNAIISALIEPHGLMQAPLSVYTVFISGNHILLVVKLKAE